MCARSALMTPAGPRRQACSTPRCCRHPHNGVGSRDLSFGAQSRSSRTPCVRFAAGVAAAPRNTRFRLVANLCRAGVATCWAPSEGFSSANFLLRQASWRTMGNNPVKTLPTSHWYLAAGEMTG
jgi:hypothetical protein